MQNSAQALIPSPFRGRARVGVSVGVEINVAPKNCSLNNHLTPIPTFPLTWGRSFKYRSILIPSPFRGRARVGVKSNFNIHCFHLSAFPLTWGRSFKYRSILIPSPFRGRARVGVGINVAPKNCSLNHHSTPIPTFPLTWGRSFNYAK